MDQELITLLDDFINLLDNNALIKDLKILKNSLKKDTSIKALLQKEIALKDLVSYRKALFSHDNIKKYLAKENELNLLILSINQKLNKLVNKKGCLKCV